MIAGEAPLHSTVWQMQEIHTLQQEEDVESRYSWEPGWGGGLSCPNEGQSQKQTCHRNLFLAHCSQRHPEDSFGDAMKDLLEELLLLRKHSKLQKQMSRGRLVGILTTKGLLKNRLSHPQVHLHLYGCTWGMICRSMSERKLLGTQILFSFYYRVLLRKCNVATIRPSSLILPQ